jgi:tetratricopeptide (TPR) repeat protein
MTTIIQRPLFFLILLFAISSCNNNEQPVTKQDELPNKEKTLRDAIALYPDSTALRDSLIYYFEENGNIDVAIAEANKATAHDSSNANFWDIKALLYIEKRDTANAVKAYEKAIDIFPDPEYIMSVGLLYAYTKNNNALVMADALLVGKNAAAEKEALIIKGIYYSTINEKQKALAFFNTCLQLSYTYMPAYLQKGITLYEMGKYDESIKVLSKAVTLQNSFSEGYYWMGKCYEKLKDVNAASESYKTAVLYDPDYTEAKDALGKLGSPLNPPKGDF